MSLRLGERAQSFKARLARGDFLLGIFQKTPHFHVTEVLSMAPLDLICLDAEHAPFNRETLDQCCAIARANDLPAVERIVSNTPAAILDCLDRGALGVVVPHVRSAAEAQSVAKACAYGEGGRGFAGSTRAAGYGSRGMPGHLAGTPNEVSVIAQIEDPEALLEIDAIAAVPGIDCLFIGRADLTVALGAATPKDPVVIEAVERIIDACLRAKRAVGMFVADLDEIPHWRERGASLFLLASDHALMMDGARGLRSRVGD
ncbi:HpcH/HpaI aldolase family protein [Litorivicinus lipolyticus]|uniref:HpcH/HpaI aldolase family protein n=1 Tax=Litorivicinus lipolyticus TaxID=418701 RepID=UPI003B5C1B5A